MGEPAASGEKYHVRSAETAARSGPCPRRRRREQRRADEAHAARHPAGSARGPNAVHTSAPTIGAGKMANARQPQYRPTPRARYSAGKHRGDETLRAGSPISRARRGRTRAPGGRSMREANAAGVRAKSTKVSPMNGAGARGRRSWRRQVSRERGRHLQRHQRAEQHGRDAQGLQAVEDDEVARQPVPQRSSTSLHHSRLRNEGMARHTSRLEIAVGAAGGAPHEAPTATRSRPRRRRARRRAAT